MGDVTVPPPITRCGRVQTFGIQPSGLLLQVPSKLHTRLPLVGDVLYPILQLILKLVSVGLATVGDIIVPLPIKRFAREQILAEQLAGRLFQLPSGLHSRDPLIGEVLYPA